MFPQTHLTTADPEIVSQFLELAPAETPAAKAAFAALPAHEGAFPSGAESADQSADQGAQGALEAEGAHKATGAQGAQGAHPTQRAPPFQGTQSIDSSATTTADGSVCPVPSPPRPTLSPPKSLKPLTWTLSATAPTDQHPYGTLHAHAPRANTQLNVVSKNTHEGVKYSVTVHTPSETTILAHQEPFATAILSLSELSP